MSKSYNIGKVMNDQIPPPAFTIPVDHGQNNNAPESVPNKKDSSKTWKALYGGMFLILVSTFLYANVLILAKVLKERHSYDGALATFWRYSLSVLATLPIILLLEFDPCHQKDKIEDSTSVFHQVWPLTDRQKLVNFGGLLLRGVLGPVNVLFRFYALEYMQAGDVSTISYSYPVLVLILAHFLLGEKLRISSVVMAALAFLGIAIITRPPFLTGNHFDSNDLIGVGLSLTSAIVNAIAIIFNRKLRKLHWTIMIFTIGLFGISLGAGTAFTKGEFTWPSGEEQLWMVSGLALLSYSAQIMKILAYKFEKAGPLTLLRMTHPIFSFVLQFAILGVIPDIYSWVGASIVIFAIFLTGLAKWIGSLPDGSGVRKTFWFLLK